MRTIAISGPMGAGKSVLAQELGNRAHLPVLSFGTLVRAEAERRGLGLDRPTLQDLGAELFSSLGPDEFVQALFQGVEGAAVVEGIRHVGVYEALTRVRPDCLLIFVTASEETLDERWALRGDNGLRPVNARHVVESELPALQSLAAVVIDTGQLNLEAVTAVSLAAALNWLS